MRSLFLLVVFANLAVLALGQGLFGPPPSEQGRQPRQLSERNQSSITLKTPLPVSQTASGHKPSKSAAPAAR
ncbi:hypothetical protein D7I39_03925 [Allopusillimonas ginsengisoli]|nr:hypothetical protein D7I39_03925 [Allopusillimonas ginsengisoli]